MFSAMSKRNNPLSKKKLKSFFNLILQLILTNVTMVYELLKMTYSNYKVVIVITF